MPLTRNNLRTLIWETPHRSLFTSLSADRKGKCAWKCQKALPWVLFKDSRLDAQCLVFRMSKIYFIAYMRACETAECFLWIQLGWLSNTNASFISGETSSFESVKNRLLIICMLCISACAKCMPICSALFNCWHIRKLSCSEYIESHTRTRKLKNAQWKVIFSSN